MIAAAQRVGEALAGRRAIIADTDLRLWRFFGIPDGWWLRLQVDYDTEIAKAAPARIVAKDQAVDRIAQGQSARTLMAAMDV